MGVPLRWDAIYGQQHDAFDDLVDNRSHFDIYRAGKSSQGDGFWPMAACQ